MRHALPASPQVKLHEVWARSMDDFANSGYTSVAITAAFGAYFVGVVCASQPWCTLAWTAALSVSYASILITGPVIGVWADAHATSALVLTPVRWLAMVVIAAASHSVFSF